MVAILERIAQSRARARLPVFRPSAPEDLVALALARKLEEPAAVAHYRELIDRHGEASVLAAYRRSNHAASGRAAAFHAALGRRKPVASHPPPGRLLAVRIERRTVAVALFAGEQLEFTQARHLSSDSGKALASTAAFISLLCSRFAFPSAALEAISGQSEVQRTALSRTATEILLANAVSVWTVSKRELFASFSYPPLKCRKELRPVAAAIWPLFGGTGSGGPLIVDAVALGGHCQIERRFLS